MHNFTATGFPSPAEDYIKPKLDLNTYLITRPAATFFMRSATSELKEYGIFHNDILIVDRAEAITKNAIAEVGNLHGTAQELVTVVH